MLVLMIGCSKNGEPPSQKGPPPAPPPDSGSSKPPPAPTPKPTASVVLEGASGPQKVWVEIVRKRDEIRRGLMFREHMPQDQGMLFLMGEEKVHTFYMRNTLIPLDIIFITRDKTVAGVVENAVPLDETSRGVDKPSVYVLEVNGGWAKAHGVGPGTKVAFVDVNE
jgi:uncharacterized membrane protein (UPF0127 family)